jgi:hypothetical protein
VFAVNKIHALTRRIQLTGWGCGGTRKINRLFDLPLAAADAQVIWSYVGKNSIYSNSLDVEVNDDKTEGIFGNNRSKRLS